jgi:hypothetical protein
MRCLGIWLPRTGFGRVTSLEHSPTSLNVSVKVLNIKTPRTGAAPVFVRNQTLLNEIAELPLANCQILGSQFGFYEPRNDGLFG